MRTISFSDARHRLKQVIDRPVEDADVTVITRHDVPDAAVTSLETINSWQATVHLLEGASTR